MEFLILDLNTKKYKNMKKGIFTFSLLVACFGLFAQDGGAQMKFETPVIDYGTIEHKADGQRVVLPILEMLHLLSQMPEVLVAALSLPGLKSP